ncbi:MAG TPA: VWA domain-containing protein [Pyrinomonadaceae bacterium]|jgi:VWFA-related protein|nr:VWA domain-containing protein [Pyrinomonadaceae bacterium]
MNPRRLSLIFASFAFVIFAAAPLCAQSGVRPKPTPTPQDDEAERIYIEEVRLPVFAYDEQGRPDIHLETDDVLVVEDNVPQQVRSVRRVPASVVLVLGTGWDLDPIVRANDTRDIALSVIAGLREGDRLAVIQFNERVDTLQGWTPERVEASRAVKGKLASGSGSNMSKAIKRATELLAETPVGNRHLVLVTDGIDTASSKDREDAVKRLIAAQATLHVISYTAVAGEAVKKPWWKNPPEKPGATQARADQATVGIDPTRPPGMRGPGINPVSVNSGITFDPALKRRRKEAEAQMMRGEARLKTLTEETGGRILLPETVEGMVEEGAAVARDIDSQYVVTYSPKRPLRRAPATEYRKVHVGARRVGLTLRARRGYVVGSMRQPDRSQK